MGWSPLPPQYKIIRMLILRFLQRSGTETCLNSSEVPENSFSASWMIFVASWMWSIWVWMLASSRYIVTSSLSVNGGSRDMAAWRETMGKKYNMHIQSYIPSIQETHPQTLYQDFPLREIPHDHKSPSLIYQLTFSFVLLLCDEAHGCLQRALCCCQISLTPLTLPLYQVVHSIVLDLKWHFL